MTEHDDEPTRPHGGSTALLVTRVLVFWDGGSATHLLAPDSSLTIGRNAESDVVIDLASVSRKHARIRGGNPVTIEDLGGMNGVRVRGEKIAVGEPIRAFGGDVIELGGAVIVIQGPRPDRPQSNPKASPLSYLGTADEPMKVVERLIALVAPSDIGVLLLGETGVGKTIAAKEIHTRSARARGPLLRLNCAAMPEALLESELFGYERGAFTGAVQAKAGLFESANGGTVLLDEIGEMPAVIQAKLLTVIETREVQRLGSISPRAIDVRFLAATHSDLLARAQEGAFRADLYYRLNGISIVIPPLRERPAEIEEFATRFLTDACARAGRQPSALSGDALAVLLRYPFPGNLRELRNTMDRAAVLAEGGEVLPEHLLFEAPRANTNPATPYNAWSPLSRPPLNTPSTAFAPIAHPPPPPPPPSSSKLRDQVGAFEKDRIVKALAECNGNQTRAAELLGMSRRSLVARIEQYRLPRPRKK